MSSHWKYVYVPPPPGPPVFEWHAWPPCPPWVDHLEFGIIIVFLIVLIGLGARKISALVKELKEHRESADNNIKTLIDIIRWRDAHYPPNCDGNRMSGKCSSCGKSTTNEDGESRPPSSQSPG